MADHLVVCSGCGRGVPRARWADHRATCLALDRQLALSAELEPDAVAADLGDDVRRGFVRAPLRRPPPEPVCQCRRCQDAGHHRALKVMCESCCARAGDPCVHLFCDSADAHGRQVEAGEPRAWAHRIRLDLAAELYGELNPRRRARA